MKILVLLVFTWCVADLYVFFSSGTVIKESRSIAVHKSEGGNGLASSPLPLRRKPRGNGGGYFPPPCQIETRAWPLSNLKYVNCEVLQ